MDILTEKPSPARIHQLRYYLDMTQQEFADMLHSKRRTVQDWEAGTSAMHLGLWELALIKAERIKPLPNVWVE